MEKRLRWIEMAGDQRRIFIDSAQLHSAYMEASVKSRAYRGGMHWKKVKGREYLFRSVDRRGYGKSLGLRSPEGDAVYREFHENKKRIMESLRQLQGRLKEQARFCKAARIARVPRVVGSILRLLEAKRLLGTSFQVIGTNALYAYEAAAGVFFESGLMATQDIDILWDVRSQLHAADKIELGGFLAILQQADRSFELIRKRSFRAVNRKGYMVDLLKPEPRPAHLPEKRRMGVGGDLVAAEIRNLQWLVSPFCLGRERNGHEHTREMARRVLEAGEGGGKDAGGDGAMSFVQAIEPWIGEIPADWRLTAIKRLVSTKVTDGPHETPGLADDGVQFISAEAIKNNRIDFDLRRGFITWKLHEQYSRKCKPHHVAQAGSRGGQAGTPGFYHLSALPPEPHGAEGG
jgi:hypothetical protein